MTAGFVKLFLEIIMGPNWVVEVLVPLIFSSIFVNSFYMVREYISSKRHQMRELLPSGMILTPRVLKWNNSSLSIIWSMVVRIINTALLKSKSPIFTNVGWGNCTTGMVPCLYTTSWRWPVSSWLMWMDGRCILNCLWTNIKKIVYKPLKYLYIISKIIG